MKRILITSLLFQVVTGSLLSQIPTGSSSYNKEKKASVLDTAKDLPAELIPIYEGSCGDRLEICGGPECDEERYRIINAVLALEKAKKIWLRNKFLGFAEPMIAESGIRKISSKEFLRRTYLFKEIRLEDFYADGDFEAMRSQQYDEPENIDTAAINREGLKFAKSGSFDIKRGEDDRFLTITKPLFSLDRTKAVIYVEARCWDGCNNGSVYVMRKQKDTLKWEFAYTVTVWVE